MNARLLSRHRPVVTWHGRVSPVAVQKVRLTCGVCYLTISLGGLLYTYFIIFPGGLTLFYVTVTPRIYYLYCVSDFSFVGIILNSRYVTTSGDFGSSVLTYTLQYVISTIYGNFGDFHFQGNFSIYQSKLAKLEFLLIFLGRFRRIGRIFRVDSTYRGIIWVCLLFLLFWEFQKKQENFDPLNLPHFDAALGRKVNRIDILYLFRKKVSFQLT